MQTGAKVVKVWLRGYTLRALVGYAFPTFSFGLGLAGSEPPPMLCQVREIPRRVCSWLAPLSL